MTPKYETYREIRLILGDQLNIDHSWFKDKSPDVLYVMMEIKPESEYVRHHIQKIIGIFLNMRKFASQLTARGHELKYFHIGDKDNLHTFKDNLELLIENYQIRKGAFLEPDEYRLDELLENIFKGFRIPYSKQSTEHFYTDREELQRMFSDKSGVIMETFYRKMRKSHRILLEGDQPIGGQWNYDRENRKRLPKDHKPPSPICFDHDVTGLMDEITRSGIDFVGSVDVKHFLWPKGRSEAKKMVNFFLEELLANFGSYQDTMSNKYWSIYHSRLAFALNIKLLSPKEVVSAAEEYWKAHQRKITIAQVEGFIRQILGWREYMRGIYWSQMPHYEQLNFFNHSRPLPSYFWTGNTKMNCVHKAIMQSLDLGYAHHIQRLMVTGNFCLLAGIDPDEVDEWYLGIYIDAFQWVEITNTRGMSQFADGGLVGTKPYVSSAGYIHKMGEHCSSCHYKYNRRTGEKACPFNSLYWRFLAKNEDKLSSNPRMTMMYRQWAKMDQTTKNELIDQANYYLDFIEEL